MSQAQIVPLGASSAPSSLAPFPPFAQRPHPVHQAARLGAVDVDDLVERVSWLLLSAPNVDQRYKSPTTEG